MAIAQRSTSETRSYFQLVDIAATPSTLSRLYYRSPDAATTDRFCRVNGLKPNETVYPGHFVLIPGLDGNAETDAGVRTVQEQVNHTIRNATTPIDARRFNEDFDILHAASSNKEEMEFAAKFFEGTSKYMEVRLKMITEDFKKLEDLYKQALRANVKLNSAQFSTQRRAIEARLKAQLTGFTREQILRNPKAVSIKDALGISHKSLAKSFRSGGNPIEVKEIGQAVTKTAKLAQRLKAVGAIGNVLSIGSSVGTIAEDYSKGGALAAVKTTGREAAGLAGGMAAGEIGAEIGTAAALLFGVGTGGVGFVVLGICAVGGAALVGWAGSELSKSGYDRTQVLVEKGAVAAVQTIIR